MCPNTSTAGSPIDRFIWSAGIWLTVPVISTEPLKKEHGKPFAGCTGEQQDAILKTFADGDFKAGKFDGSVFFQQLMELTLEGYLSDPKYGGNRNRVGWHLIGIPDGLRSCWWNPHGVEMVLSPDEGFQD